MCGIVYAKSLNNKDMTSTVLRRFEDQRMRGTTSFGFFLPQNNKLVHNVHEGRIKSLLRRTRGDNTEILFHHRMSTSTVDVRNACHPFSTKDAFDYEYIGVHNGVLHNEQELYKDHSEKGINYISTQPNGDFNDSEALIYDLASYIDGKTTEIKAAGSIAFIIVKLDKDGHPRTLYFGTNRGSLNMKKTKDSLIISSEGEGEALLDNHIYMFDYDTEEIRSIYAYIPSTSYKYAGYSSPNRTTYGGNVNNWEDDDDDLVRGFTQAEIDAMSMSFTPRKGNKKQIRADFLKENNNNETAAIIAIQLEIDEAKLQMDTLDAMADMEASKETKDAIIEYWWEVSEYTNTLQELVDDYVLIPKEEELPKEFGFHSTSEIAPTNQLSIIKKG